MDVKAFIDVIRSVVREEVKTESAIIRQEMQEGFERLETSINYAGMGR